MTLVWWARASKEKKTLNKRASPGKINLFVVIKWICFDPLRLNLKIVCKHRGLSFMRVFWVFKRLSRLWESFALLRVSFAIHTHTHTPKKSQYGTYPAHFVLHQTHIINILNLCNLPSVCVEMKWMEFEEMIVHRYKSMRKSKKCQ